MQSRAFVVFALVFATSVAAQSNPFVVFPQDPERQAITAASYVRRPDWNNQAEGFQQVTQDLLRGVGDLGSASMANGFYHWAGDLDSLTAETYGVILRTADALGQPDITPAGIIVQVQGLSLPTTTTGGNTGWVMTNVLATPAALPATGSWFQGLDLPANPAWPSGTPPDGHSIWAADTLAAGTPAVVGENGRQSAPAVTWAVTPTGAIFRTQWTYIMGTLVDNPTLHVGGIDPLSARTGVLGDPSYGMNGLFPDLSGSPRSDGLNLRMQDNQSANGLAIFAGSTGWWAGSPISIGGFAGNLHIDIINMIIIGFALPSAGAAVLPVATPGTLSPSLIGSEFMFQGVWFDAVTGGGRFSNGQVTQF